METRIAKTEEILDYAMPVIGQTVGTLIIFGA